MTSHSPSYPDRASWLRDKYTKLIRARSGLIQFCIFVFILLLVIGPIIPVIYQSLIDRPLYDQGGALTLKNYQNLFADSDFYRALFNSLILATISTLVAQVVGVIQAILLGRTNMPGRWFFGTVLLAPLFIADTILVFGWFILYGPSGYSPVSFGLYTLVGMSVVAGISQAPLTMVYCMSSASLADSNMEDAARISGAKRWSTIRSITLPLMFPAILYSAVLNFIIGIESLSIPLVLGEPAGLKFFGTYIYSRAFGAVGSDYGIVGSASVMMIVVVMLLIFLQGKVLSNAQRFNSVGGKSSRPRRIDIGKLRWPAAIMLGVYALLFIIGPIGALFLRSAVSFLSPLVPFWNLFTFDNYQTLISSPQYARSITNTLMIAFFGGIFAAVLTAMISVVCYRSDFKFRGAMEYIVMLPRAIPGMIAGLGFLYALMLLPQLSWLQNSIFILVLAYTVRHMPNAIGAVSPSLFQVGADMERSARTMGADWWTASTKILMPIIKAAIFGAFSLLFIQFVKEYTTALFLIAPGSEVMGVTLLKAWANGESGTVAALSTLQILITVVFLYATRRLFGVKIYG